MPSNKILICTATYNESENIIDLIKAIENLNIDLDILIIDDNSPDNTGEIIQNYINNKDNIILKTRESKSGLDTAHKYAYKYAKKNNYEYFITLDADFSHNPSEIINFLNELNNYDFIIGSRYVKGGQCEMKGFRLLLSYFGNKVIKTILNINCDEFTTSYRGFNLKKMNNFDLDIVKSKGYSFFMETIYQIHKNNNSIKQIPIIFKDRTKGISKIPKIEIFRTLYNLAILKIRK
jgi:dolichol-phosphate mannosyltransferase|tara:strand:+ start:716 stop:1420 length:705 start_codon:yes stop_codon:yes gene_type:complete